VFAQHVTVIRNYLEASYARILALTPCATGLLGKYKGSLSPLYASLHTHAQMASCSFLCFFQAGAHFEEAVKLYGGSISSQAAASSTGTTTVLVTTDLQKPDLSRVPPDINELHLTTVDHVLVSLFCT